MLLKNLMEEKQLDFNQPLLSVRRFSSTVSTTETESKRKTNNALPKVPPLPVYKSELKSGPVRNPGTVPFVWERSPGRPKYENKPQTVALEQPPAVPKLPPGRIFNVGKKAFDKGSEGTIAGQSETKDSLLASHNIPTFDKISINKKEISRDGIEETFSSEDDKEAYVDALDTLSRSESFFLNCSISGVSGLDGPEPKPSGTFSTDRPTLDFMMGRFLPAAKALASEAPQHSTRKKLVAQEQPSTIKKMVSVEKPRSLSPSGRVSNMSHCAVSNMSHCAHCDEVEETGDEDDDYDGPDNSSVKVCGLFPRICLQNSFCLLNPVPGMRKQGQAPLSSSLVRNVKSSDAAYCSESMNEVAASNQRSMGALEKTGMLGDKNKLKSETSKIVCRNYCQTLDGSSLYKRLQANGASSYCDKFSQSALNEDKRTLPENSKTSRVGGMDMHSKAGKNFRELLPSENNEWESASAGPLVEKTLYIDSVQNPQISNSSFSDMKGSLEYRRDDTQGLKDVGTEETAFVDSSLQDMKHLNAVSEKANVLQGSLESANFCLSLLSGRSMHNVKVANYGKIDSEIQLCKESDDQDTSNNCYSLLPLPPPLPKSPSESWLKRTLPAVCSKHTSWKSCLRMNVHPRVQASKMHSPDPKWETIVKTSNAQHGHSRFSEELLTPIPEV